MHTRQPQESDMQEEKALKGAKAKKQKTRKHPLAPKKPRSAFILYSQYMHNETKMFASKSEDSKEKV